MYLGHALGGFCVGAAGRVGVDLLAGDGLEELDELGAQGVLDDIVVIGRRLRGGRDGRGQLDLADGRDKSDDLDAESGLQVLLSDSAGSDTTNGLARATASTTAARLDAILFEVRPVGVARAGVEIGLQKALEVFVAR